jgi:5-methylcytosine-specific restriction endonuclease McrA
VARGARRDNIYSRILYVLGEHPEGISINSMRRALGLAAHEQQHLDRRVRYLGETRYHIDRVRERHEILYVLRGSRKVYTAEPPINKTLRAKILHLCGGRCQMCGRSIVEDGVKLHIDHRIPKDPAWGGKTEEDNLWALCSECNEGKKHFFASITDQRIREAMAHKSVHVRIGELLRRFQGQEVPKQHLQFVAAFTHEDWEKRMRELRELGWRYRVVRRKEKGRIHTYFILNHHEPWPADPAAAIRLAEARKRR